MVSTLKSNFINGCAMLTIETVRARLEPMNLRKVAAATDLHYNTVRHLMLKTGEEADYRTVKILSDYLEALSEKTG